MRYAIFSDIHANLEALETAVSEAEKKKIDAYAVLGDTLGYGANPNECFEWVLQHASISLMGNHEKAVVDLSLREWFNPFAREAIEWTAGILQEKFKAVIPEIPFVRHDPLASFAHAGLADPEKFSYLFRFSDAEPTFKQMRSAICFVGHTHVPGCFCESKQTAEHLKPGVIQLDKKDKYVLNPGSVGQPRDRDPRLSFGVFDDQAMTFEIVRREYDNEKAAGKIRQAGLPVYLAERLL